MHYTQQEINNIIQWLQQYKIPDNMDTSTNQWRIWRAKANKHTVKDNKLYFNNLECVAEEDKDNVLNQIYSSPSTGFVGRDKLYHRVKQQYYNITEKDVSNYLNKSKIHQIHHKPPQYSIVKPIISTRVNERWEIDHVDMSSLKTYNLGFSWILNIIDHHSKYLWSFATKTKDMKEVHKILESLFTNKNRPEILQSDNAFTSPMLTELCNKYKVRQIFSNPYKPSTNGLVERVNQTIKSMLYKFMSNNNTKMWINVLPKIVNNYNTSYHCVIKSTPEESYRNKSDNTTLIMQNATKMLQKSNKNQHVSRLRPGTTVRYTNLSLPEVRKDQLFNKKYKPNYSENIYTIASVSKSTQPEYRLKADNNKRLTQKFYGYQLLPVAPKDETIEPIQYTIRSKFFDKTAHIKQVNQSRRITDREQHEKEKQQERERIAREHKALEDRLLNEAREREESTQIDTTPTPVKKRTKPTKQRIIPLVEEPDTTPVKKRVKPVRPRIIPTI